MANLTSKLVIGGSIAIVLLMLFSAIPVAAEETNDTPEQIEVSYGTSASGNKWSWDGNDCILNLYDGAIISSIKIYTTGSDKDGKILVNGTVNLTYSSLIGIYSGSNDFTVTGGGKIIVEKGYVSSYADPSSFFILDNVSMKFNDGFDPCIATLTCNIVIQNCESIDLAVLSYEAYSWPIYNACGTVEIIDSNVHMTNAAGTGLIYAKGGIIMSNEPSGEGLVYDTGTWQSGKTTTISGSGPGCSLTMESYVPPEPEPESSSVNMYDVSLYATMAAAVVLILIGSIYAGKH